MLEDSTTPDVIERVRLLVQIDEARAAAERLPEEPG
jgi:hypothetical protein